MGAGMYANASACRDRDVEGVKGVKVHRLVCKRFVALTLRYGSTEICRYVHRMGVRGTKERRYVLPMCGYVDTEVRKVW
jgi:hypothetical protein